MKSDDAFWFSKLSDSQQCLKYYELKHVIKEPVEEELSADLEFGTAVHAGLHKILLGEDGEAAFLAHWEFSKDLDLQYGRHEHPILLDIGARLLARFKRLHAKKFKPFKMEERAYAEFDGVKLEGTPDFVGEFMDVPSILDFKTSGYRYDKRKILCDAQMPLYAALAKAAWGYECLQRVYVVFVKDANQPTIQIIKAPLTPMIVYDNLSNVIETCKELQVRKSFTKNTRNCIQGSRVCPYFTRCWGGVTDGEDS